MTEHTIGSRPLRIHSSDERGERLVLQASAEVLRLGLVEGASAFTPERRIWTSQNADEVVVITEAALQGGTKNFAARFEERIRHASPGAIQLAAECQYLIQLPAADIKPDVKRERVAALLSLLPTKTDTPAHLSRACDGGVFNVGMGFKMQGWRQQRSLSLFVQNWTRLPASARRQAASDPWFFKQVVHHGEGAQAMRNLLLYLSFPDAFEPIVSQKHKTDIRNALGEGRQSPDVDVDLLAIRDRLEQDIGRVVSFYDPEFVVRWRKPGTSVHPPVPPKQRAWLVRAARGRGAQPQGGWLESGYCALAADKLSAGRAGMSREAVAAQVESDYSFTSYSERMVRTEEFYDFLTRMSPDDIVLTTRDARLYAGRVTGPAEYRTFTGGAVALMRPVDWMNPDSPADITDLSPSLQARLRTQADVVDLTQDLDELAPLLDSGSPDGQDVDPGEVERATAVLPQPDQDLADDLLLPLPWLQDLVAGLAERRQIVLYGPPGTGKTYLAKTLAPYLTGEPQNVKLVQFHPAYSYEDFFEGFRPRVDHGGTMAFDLRPGPFRRLVDRARQDPGQPYVLIIDELNRANLASVFGELYFLLEHRDEAISLLYSGDEQSFTLPENVYLIGTMNTADRSVALVDAAMRRRFAFFSLHPADEPVEGLLRRWLERQGLPASAANLLTALNRQIGDHDAAIGPSYFMRPDLYRGDAQTVLRRIWATSIIPLLEEHHYGDLTPPEVREQYSLEKMLSLLPQPGTS